jgi:hypothetical protein
MALVRSFTRKPMERNSLHEEVDATYTVFENDGRVLLQIDSYGRENRQIPGKKSQSLQLDKAGAAALFAILKHEFLF